MIRRNFIKGCVLSLLSVKHTKLFAKQRQSHLKNARNDISVPFYFISTGKDDTASLQKALNDNSYVIITKQKHVTQLDSNIVIPSNTHLVLENDIQQCTLQHDRWSLKNVISKYPLFKIKDGSSCINIEGDGLVSVQYEAVAAFGRPDNLIQNLKISLKVSGGVKDVNNDYFSYFGGLSFYCCAYVTVVNSIVENCGIKPRWQGKRIGGGANGYGFYNCNHVKLSFAKSNRCGGSGVFFNNCNFFSINKMTNQYNGLSGIQLGVHPDARYGIISHNENKFNTADGIDVRWVGDNIIPINLLVYGNKHTRNGFFDAQLHMPTQDGSGIITLVNVMNVSLFNNVSTDSAGSFIYIENCKNIIANNNTGSVFTSKEGIFLVKYGEGISIKNTRVLTNGNALVFSDKSEFKDIHLSGLFNSTTKPVISMGEKSNYINVKVAGAFKGHGQMNKFGGDWSQSTFSCYSS